jgi:hypothetical protein
MRFAIGASTFAKCSTCQGEDFYPAFPLTPDRREVVVCARCENQAVFAELVGKPGASTQAWAKKQWTAPKIPTRARPSRRSRSR